MRGFKVDQCATALLFKNGLFMDRRSKLVYDLEMAPHLLLKGADMSRQRERVFRRDGYRCKIKGANCSKSAYELDHKQGGLSGRCDCEHNLQSACIPDHRGKHLQVRWTVKRVQAHQDFEKIHNEEAT